MTKAFLYLALFLSAFSVHSPARAQDCTGNYELIFDLKDGKLGSYNIWDAIYGEQEYEERFTSALPAEDDHNVAVGVFYETPEYAPQLLVARLDHRGREVWTQIHKIGYLENIVKILPHDKGYMVVGNTFGSKKNHTIWLGFLDADGALLRESAIKANGHLKAHDIIPAYGGKGYLMATTFEPKGEKVRAALYSLNSKGGVIKSRTFMPGLENSILGLSAVEENQYLAQGFVEAADGRLAGWVMKLNEDASLIWQQQYKRGSGAQLMAGHPYNKDYMVVVGRADPAGHGKDLSAGWVMMLSAFDGEIAWQRYYTGSYHYEATDVLVSKDGLTSVLLNGKVDVEEARIREEEGLEPKVDYASLLTINPRGALMIRDAYYNGTGSHASQLYFGPRRERIMAGHTNMAYKIEAIGDAEEMTKRSIQGWLLAAEETEPYSDPCAR